MGILRLLLAFSVVFTHSAPFPLTANAMTGGLVAVQGFYIISGFYMALVLNKRYQSPWPFYFNRFLRLYPTYWAVLGLYLLVHITTGQPTVFHAIIGSEILKWDGKVLMLFANFLIWGSDIMMFIFPSPDGLRFTADFTTHGTRMLYPFHAIPQAWTLPVEMYFYLMAPFVVRKPAVLAGLVSTALLGRYIVYLAISPGDLWNYRFFPLELAFFCLGALAFHAYEKLKEFKNSSDIGAILLIVLVVYILNFPRVPVLFPSSPIFSGQLLQIYFVFLLSLPFVFHFSRENKIDQWIGELSYPVYLLHMLIIHETGTRLPSLSGKDTNGVYSIVIYTIAAAVLLNLLVQSPIERRYKKAN